MKKSKFKDSQIVGLIKRAEAGEPVASLKKARMEAQRELGQV